MPPGIFAAAWRRARSPPNGSILMICAPISPKYWVQAGPCRTWQKLTTFIEFKSMSSPLVGDRACASSGYSLVRRFGGHPAPVLGVIRADRQLDRLPGVVRVIASGDEFESGAG